MAEYWVARARVQNLQRELAKRGQDCCPEISKSEPRGTGSEQRESECV